MNLMPTSSNSFWQGTRDSVNAMIGTAPVAMTYGILAVSSGIPFWTALAISCIVYSPTTQLITVNLMASGAATVQLMLVAIIVNLKGLLTSTLVMRKAKQPIKKLFGLALAFLINDQTFAIMATQKKPRSEMYALGVNLSPYLTWVVFTLVGLLLAPYIPQLLLSALGIAIFALFISSAVDDFNGSWWMIVAFFGTAIIASFQTSIPLLKSIPEALNLLIIPVVIVAILATGKYFLRPDVVEAGAGAGTRTRIKAKKSKKRGRK